MKTTNGPQPGNGVFNNPQILTAAGQMVNANAYNGCFAQAIKPASAIASAEDTLRAARVLAGRVEHIIDRLCGDFTTKSTGCADGAGEAYSPPVLVRLRRASEETDDAITRASAALDRLDVELN